MLLYFHVPFCDSKCHYCSFNSYTDLIYLKEKYFEALEIQLRFELERFNIQKNQIETIFIGGGTPSTVDAKLYEPLFKIVTPYLKNNIEITTEANPNSLNREWIEGMKKLGVNRVSIGVQSFDEKKLKFLGRNHDKNQAIKAVVNAYQSGIKNISIDLIYDTILDNPKLLENDLDTAFSLPINHLSAYSLTIEKGTKFYKEKNLTSEKYTRWFTERIKEKFEQYEISNFGTYQSRHNIGYWKLKNYIGVGSGAVGFLKNKRFYPTKNLHHYIKNPLDISEEILTPKDIKLEKIFLGLRSKVGVDLKIFTKNELEKVNLLLQEKKITLKNNYIFNNDYLLSDEIALFLMQD